jgi:hypothetical protein
MVKALRWHRITLSRQEYESGEMAVLVSAFRAAYIAKNGPKGMAMFGCWAYDGTSYHVYTTPGSVRHITPLLEAYSAHPVDTKVPAGLSLLAGDESGRFSSEFGFEA